MLRFTIIALLAGLTVFAFSALSSVSAQQNIADEQAAWEALGIEAYYIAFQDASVWNLLQLDLWVQDGRVQMLRASCQPGLVGSPCNLGRINAWQFEVGELFKQANQAGERLARIEYDATYHYPTLISLDDTQLVDDERILRVTAFQALPAGATSPDGYATAVAQATLTSAVIPTVSPVASEVVPTATPYTPPQVYPLTFSPVAPAGDLNAWLDDAEARWNAQGVDSYTLTLSETTPWNGLDLTLQVRDGRPVWLEASCHLGWMRGPCDVYSLDSWTYRIPELLERLREAALVDDARTDSQAVDSATGIPIRIFFDDPEMFDEESEIIVSRVVLLEAPAR